MSKELFFIGAPVQFKTGVYIYPPTLKEVITNQGYGKIQKNTKIVWRNMNDKKC